MTDFNTNPIASPRLRVSAASAINALVLTLLLSLALPAAADSIRLLEQGRTIDGRITLGQVAELEGDYAQSLADTLLAADVGRVVAEHEVSLRQVREALTEAGVNWANLSLVGRRTCVVSVGSADVLPRRAEVVNDRAVLANDELDASVAAAGQTVADLLRAQYAELVGTDADKLQITFATGADEQAWLTRSTAVGRYELEPLSRSGLGRVPVKVRRYSPAGTVEQVTLTAEVAQRAIALVVTRQVRRGEPLGLDNLAQQEVLLTADHGQVIDDFALISSQTAATSLREGTVLLAGHVAPDVLIERGDLVTVAAVHGSLVVRTVGRATEAGSQGDLIAVRNDATRQTIYAVVSGPRQATVATELTSR